MAQLFYYDKETLEGVSVMNYNLTPLPPNTEGEPYVVLDPPVDIEEPNSWEYNGESVVYKGRVITSTEVNAEKDRRIAEGFSFKGHMFDFDEVAKSNINGAGSLAGIAIIGGATVGDYRWSDADKDFEWITKDNVRLKLDAFDMLEMAKTAANHVSYYTFKARDIKDIVPIPEDYKEDKYWN